MSEHFKKCYEKKLSNRSEVQSTIHESVNLVRSTHCRLRDYRKNWLGPKLRSRAVMKCYIAFQITAQISYRSKLRTESLLPVQLAVLTWLVEEKLQIFIGCYCIFFIRDHCLFFFLWNVMEGAENSQWNLTCCTVADCRNGFCEFLQRVLRNNNNGKLFSCYFLSSFVFRYGTDLLS